MASVETPDQAREARAAGWRTYRATAPGVGPGPGEVACPAPKVECAACLLCRGASLKAKSVTIEVHGSRARSALRVVTQGEAGCATSATRR